MYAMHNNSGTFTVLLPLHFLFVNALVFTAYIVTGNCTFCQNELTTFTHGVNYLLCRQLSHACLVGDSTTQFQGRISRYTNSCTSSWKWMLLFSNFNHNSNVSTNINNTSPPHQLTWICKFLTCYMAKTNMAKLIGTFFPTLIMSKPKSKCLDQGFQTFSTLGHTCR
jgi:hypothetical protein